MKLSLQKPTIIYENTHTRIHNHFTAVFPGILPVSQCQKKSSSGLYGTRENNGSRHTDHLGGRHSIRTNQQPTSSVILPIFFYARCPSCRNPPTLSWLGTGIKYAGFHTQCRGSPSGMVNIWKYTWEKLSVDKIKTSAQAGIKCSLRRHTCSLYLVISDAGTAVWLPAYREGLRSSGWFPLWLVSVSSAPCSVLVVGSRKPSSW